jgi:hypothetical protein
MKNLKTIVLIFFFLSGESSQNVGAGAHGGYACPVESTAGGQESARTVGTDEGAVFGDTQTLFTKVQINGSKGPYNFCRHEANKAIAKDMCDFCTNTKNLTPDQKIQEIISPGSMGEKLKDGKKNTEACQSKLSRFSATDCGSTCIVNIRCILAGILTRITVLGQTFAGFYNSFIEDEKNYHLKLAEFYQANKTSIHDQIKIWLIDTIADQYARGQLNMSTLSVEGQVDLISKKLVAYDAQADAGQPAKPEKFISEQCGKEINSDFTSTGDNRSSALIELCAYRKKLFDNWEETFAAAVGCRSAQNKDKASCQVNAEKYLENIFDLLLKNHSVNEYTQMFDNYPLYMFAWHALTSSFAESSANDPVNKVINGVNQLSCFLQISANRIIKCSGNDLSGVDLINGLITSLFTLNEPDEKTGFKEKINKDVLRQVLVSTAGKNYLETLNNILGPDSTNLKMPAAKLNDLPTVKNGSSTLFYGRNVPLNTYVTNYKDLSVIIVKLLASVDSPLIKILNLYVQQYMEYCSQCVTDPAALEDIAEEETAIMLCIFECKHLVEKVAKKIQELKEKIKSNEGKAETETPEIDKTEANAGAKTEANAGAKTEANAGAETEANAGAETADSATGFKNVEPEFNVETISIEDVNTVGNLETLTADSTQILERSATEVTEGCEVGAEAVAEGTAEKLALEAGEEAVIEGAVGAAGGAIAGPLMMAYMLGAAICSEIKPDEKWCDPLSEIIDLDIQSCANFNIGNSPTMPGNPQINPSQLLRPDCQLIDAIDLTYKYVVKNIPAAVGYIAQGLCYAFNGFNGKAYSDKDVCSDVESKVADGINTGIEFVAKIFSTGFGDVITGIVDIGLAFKSLADGKKGAEIKPILYPWEKDGYINDDNRKDSAATIAGLALGAVFLPGVSTLAVAIWELFRRGMNTAKTGCGTTGDESEPWPNLDCEWHPNWGCCSATGNGRNADCTGTWAHGGLLRAC